MYTKEGWIANETVNIVHSRFFIKTKLDLLQSTLTYWEMTKILTYTVSSTGRSDSQRDQEIYKSVLLNFYPYYNNVLLENGQIKIEYDLIDGRLITSIDAIFRECDNLHRLKYSLSKFNQVLFEKGKMASEEWSRKYDNAAPKEYAIKGIDVNDPIIKESIKALKTMGMNKEDAITKIQDAFEQNIALSTTEEIIVQVFKK